MIFGKFNCEDAEEVVLAHTLRFNGTAFKKGRVLSPADLDRLRENGIHEVSGVRLDAGDVDEDQAALELAHALAGPKLKIGKPKAGRCNLYARSDGLAQIDSEIINAINRCDAGIFVATLPEHAQCIQQQAVASIKVIPFAVSREQLDRCIELAGGSDAAVGLHAYRAQSVALVLTETAGLKEAMLESTSRVTAERVTAMRGQMVFEARCKHTVADVASALSAALASGAELILICGASITVDPADIIPSAIVRCDGTVEHFGIPVEPGNMLLLARLDGRTVINLPGCSRSPKLNGLDWVMQRMAAGVPMIQRVVDAALRAELVSTTVVTGSHAREIETVLTGRDITLVHNPDYREGIASSLKRGLASLPADIDGVMILLADMPFITAAHINELIAEFDPATERDIVAPIREGRLGNPVTWSTRYFPAMMKLAGDRGARSLLEECAANVWEVPMGDSAIFMDVDTPAALAAANRHCEDTA